MHPEGYHKSEAARARCLACSAPAELQPDPEDYAKAKRLIAEGWHQCSRKYRLVCRLQLPPFEEAVTLAPSMPEWLAKDVRRFYESKTLSEAAVHGEKQELTVKEFVAFRELANAEEAAFYRRIINGTL